MRLARMRIEGFRGIRSLDLEMDPFTVIIAENNHGKTSVFDVLGLCLGPRGIDPESRFREEDFYRAPDGTVSDIRIVLTFADEGGGEATGVEFFGAHADRRIHRRFVDLQGWPLEPQPAPGSLEALQRRHPLLLLRFAQPQHGWQDGDGDVPGSRRERRGRRKLSDTIAGVYRGLARTRGPIPAEQISRGLEAAYELLDGRGMEDGDAPIHRMLEDLSQEVKRWNRPRAEESVLGLFGSGSHNLALLLVLGSLLDLRGDEALPPDARPIIAIEEPESHLHPILLASTWDVIEALHAQTVVTTNSGDLLSSVPLNYLRRLVRNEHGIDVHRLRPGSLSVTDQRRVAYHIRARRGGVLFARCWMLVEGESEFWLLSQLAEVMGYDLESEGVRPIEFAQCGVGPLVKLANGLGIAWHLLSDGDESGQSYVRDALRFVPEGREDLHVSMLRYRDVETCLWYEGFEEVYRRAARIVPRPDGGDPPPGRIIHTAVRKRSKPYLAIAVAEAAAERGPASIPPVLRGVIERSIMLARDATT